MSPIGASSSTYPWCSPWLKYWTGIVDGGATFPLFFLLKKFEWFGVSTLLFEGTHDIDTNTYAIDEFIPLKMYSGMGVYK
jgi:hypothetical protein